MEMDVQFFKSFFGDKDLQIESAGKSLPPSIVPHRSHHSQDTTRILQLLWQSLGARTLVKSSGLEDQKWEPLYNSSFREDVRGLVSQEEDRDSLDIDMRLHEALQTHLEGRYLIRDV